MGQLWFWCHCQFFRHCHFTNSNRRKHIKCNRHPLAWHCDFVFWFLVDVSSDFVVNNSFLYGVGFDPDGLLFASGVNSSSLASGPRALLNPAFGSIVHFAGAGRSVFLSLGTLRSSFFYLRSPFQMCNRVFLVEFEGALLSLLEGLHCRSRGIVQLHSMSRWAIHCATRQHQCVRMCLYLCFIWSLLTF